MSDRLVAEASTWQHTTLATDLRVHATDGTRTRNPSRRAPADTCLCSLGQWELLVTHNISP